MAGLFCFESSFPSAARTQDTGKVVEWDISGALRTQLCLRSLLRKFWNPIVPDTECLSCWRARNTGAQALGQNPGPPLPFCELRQAIASLWASVSCFSNRDHCIEWHDEWAKDICLYHCVPDVWYTVAAQEMSVLLSLYDTHTFAAPAENVLKSWKECFIFYLLSIIYFLFSKAAQRFFWEERKALRRLNHHVNFSLVTS